jgi:hypothetical protein
LVDVVVLDFSAITAVYLTPLYGLNNNNMVVMAQDDKLYFLNVDTPSVGTNAYELINMHMTLSDIQGITSLAGENGNYIYLSMTSGVHRINMRYNESDTLYPSNSPRGILRHNSYLWIAEVDGVKAMDPVSTTQMMFFPFGNGGAISVCAHDLYADTVFVVTANEGVVSIRLTDSNITTLTLMTDLSSCGFTSDGMFLLFAQNPTLPVQQQLLWGYSMFNSAIFLITSQATISSIVAWGPAAILLGIQDIGVKKMMIAVKDSKDCGPGLFSKSRGLQNESQCTLCAAGDLCPSGSRLSECQPGTYSFETGLRQQEQCTVCPMGFYCLGGDHIEPCPLGYYSFHKGLTALALCTICDAGYYCPNSTLKHECPENTESPRGSSDLDSCKCMVGYKCEIVKVVHEVQLQYLMALALAAGVDVGSITIVSIQQVPGSTGQRRRRRRLLMLYDDSDSANVSIGSNGDDSSNSSGSYVVNISDRRRRESSSTERTLLQTEVDHYTHSIDVHSSIYNAKKADFSNLGTHLMERGLPRHTSIRVSLHREVKNALRMQGINKLQKK